MSETVSESGPAFDAMMKEIDEKFVRDGLPIPNRSLHAVMAVGSRFNIPMPLVLNSARASMNGTKQSMVTATK
jgi:hypothetical protein